MANLYDSIEQTIDYRSFINIIENIPSCIFLKDTELRYIFSSHHWAQLNDEEIMGKTDIDVRKDKENATKAMEADREIIRTRKGCSYVIKSDVDGQVSYLELIKEPIIAANGSVVGIVGLINDVTDKTLMEQKIVGISAELEKQCRELEASNEALQTSLEKVERMQESQKMFTASMNHELRSPLNGIIGTLELLKDDESLNDEQRDNISNAYQSSMLLLEIVNDLLDYAKIENGGPVIKCEPFNLTELINNVDHMSRNQAKAKGLDFELEIGSMTPSRYMGDSVHINQILNNLISNAIKYTEKGGIRVDISYDSGSLKIVCADTGQGMSEKSLACMFDPFTRFNEKKNSGIQGTGLGLSVVKSIIDQMNGEIKAESELEKGTTFTVTIPMETIQADSDIKIESIKVTEDDLVDYSQIDFSNVRALCVDDSKVSAKVMKNILEKSGMSADVAYSAESGIKLADENEYDVIFMDHMMPEMDGIEAFKIIRDRSIKNRNTPVVMLTGNAGGTFADYYAEEGLDGYLTKPVLKDNILKTVIRILDM